MGRVAPGSFEKAHYLRGRLQKVCAEKDDEGQSLCW